MFRDVIWRGFLRIAYVSYTRRVCSLAPLLRLSKAKDMDDQVGRSVCGGTFKMFKIRKTDDGRIDVGEIRRKVER